MSTCYNHSFARVAKIFLAKWAQVEFFSPGCNGQNRHFSAEGPVVKQIIGRVSIIYKEKN